MTHTDNRRRRVEDTCAELILTGQPATFDVVAGRAKLGRATLYRNSELRALVDEHRGREAHTLSGLASENRSPPHRRRNPRSDSATPRRRTPSTPPIQTASSPASADRTTTRPSARNSRLTAGQRDRRTLRRLDPPGSPRPHPDHQPAARRSRASAVRAPLQRPPPHRALGQAAPPRPFPGHATAELHQVLRRDRLGGLIHEYQHCRMTNAEFLAPTGRRPRGFLHYPAVLPAPSEIVGAEELLRMFRGWLTHLGHPDPEGTAQAAQPSVRSGSVAASASSSAANTACSRSGAARSARRRRRSRG